MNLKIEHEHTVSERLNEFLCFSLQPSVECISLIINGLLSFGGMQFGKRKVYHEMSHFGLITYLHEEKSNRHVAAAV